MKFTNVIQPFLIPISIHIKYIVRSDFCSNRQKQSILSEKSRKHIRLTGIAFHQLRWQGGEGVGHTCTCLRHAPEASQRHER